MKIQSVTLTAINYQNGIGVGGYVSIQRHNGASFLRSEDNPVVVSEYRFNKNPLRLARAMNLQSAFLGMLKDGEK